MSADQLVGVGMVAIFCALVALVVTGRIPL